MLYCDTVPVTKHTVEGHKLEDEPYEEDQSVSQDQYRGTMTYWDFNITEPLLMSLVTSVLSHL